MIYFVNIYYFNTVSNSLATIPPDEFFLNLFIYSHLIINIMESMHINFVAVLVATIANFFVGFVWYTPLFGNVWAKENGFDRSVKPPSGAFAKGLIMSIIGNFFLAYVFASNNLAW